MSTNTAAESNPCRSTPVVSASAAWTIGDKLFTYLTFFLEFQISYFSKLKTLMDIESIFITLLCTLNTTTHTKKELKLLNSILLYVNQKSG